MNTEEQRMLKELAILSGRINKVKRAKALQEKEQQKHLLQEVTRLSGEINKKKRIREIEDDPTQGPSKKARPEPELCMFFTKYGHCNRGTTCAFVHDKTKVAVCTKFLQGQCHNQDCLLQHSTSGLKNRMPVNENAALCPDFAKGYCPRGPTCKFKHSSTTKAPTTKQRPEAIETKPEKVVAKKPEKQIPPHIMPNFSDSEMEL